MEVADTLAYYNTATNTAVRVFIVQAQCYKTLYGRKLLIFEIS
jgi:hypothetical protein